MSQKDNDLDNGMNRRRFLTAAGTASAAALAGCQEKDADENDPLNETDAQAGSNESEIETQNNSVDNKTDEPKPEEEKNEEPEFEIPLDGLGAYEEKVREARPRQKTFNQVDKMLEQSDNPDQLADLLSSNKITTGAVEHNLYELASALYQKQEEKAGENVEDSVVFNINWSFTSDSEAIIETYTVEDGELQSQPIIADPEHGQVYMRHKPDQENPEYLKRIRDDTDWAKMVPQDYDAFMKREEFVDKDDERTVREYTFKNWSAGLFGINTDPKVIPHDGESSNVVFDGLYHDGDAEAVVELNNQYFESNLFGIGEVVSAEYTGDGWKFHKQPDYEWGDELPGKN